MHASPHRIAAPFVLAFRLLRADAERPRLMLLILHLMRSVEQLNSFSV